MSRQRPLVIALLLALSAGAAAAAQPDTALPAGDAGGLRIRAWGPLPGNAVVDFALPPLSFLLQSGPSNWLREAMTARRPWLPAWRLDNVNQAGSGLRASAGLVNVSRAAAYGVGAMAEQSVVDTLPRLGNAGATVVTASAPYVGIGWRETPAPAAWRQGGWGFNADVGVLALAPRSTVRFGRSAGGPLTLDDMARDLRLAPMLQLGISYSF